MEDNYEGLNEFKKSDKGMKLSHLKRFAINGNTNFRIIDSRERIQDRKPRVFTRSIRTPAR